MDTIQDQQNKLAVETAKKLQRQRQSKSKLNEEKSEVIQEQILQENPEGLESVVGKIALVKEVPPIERVIFRNMRDPGVTLEFHYCTKTMPLTMYKLQDGKEYDLPCEVVEHLMDRKVPVYAYKRDSDGLPQQYIKTYRFNFNIQRVRRAA